MPPEPLTRERILLATEEVLRRHGQAKATVVDVARALGVSHGSVYRHFPTKAALREAVTGRWLDRTTGELDGIAQDAAVPPAERLTRWLDALFAAKRRKAGDDPELFATYLVLTSEAAGVVDAHIGVLVRQLTRIVADGIAQGTFAAAPDAETTARAVFDATARFHDPCHAGEWQRPAIEDEFAAVCDLVLRGLRA
ncbi:TetR family transcriptional regulator [Streptomyces sp. Ru73]|uniref:TetR family transcriptional regulator n=1 Tax=Streptomyces sp. Ru73 TaxID=2080748 RepID=UPI000CDD6742|nr:TetR family transcriptional regulator [Streptomyces sp. Ru73]POX36774.1 TetR family transcriptional regulator [Streptomyces sp. Ru73]